MTQTVVLEHVGPLLKDKQGRSYKQKKEQGKNGYVKVLINWLHKGCLASFFDVKHDRSFSDSLMSKILSKVYKLWHFRKGTVFVF